MNKNEEYIICAAIWYKELELKNPIILRLPGCAPINVKEGIVFAGLRHVNCSSQMTAITGFSRMSAVVGEHIEGFLTSKNIFLSRDEANKLFNVSTSEDLY